VLGLQETLKEKVLTQLTLLYLFVTLLLVIIRTSCHDRRTTEGYVRMNDRRLCMHEQLKVVWGGHIGVTTKLIKETDELLAVTTLSIEGRTHLGAIHNYLQLRVEHVIHKQYV